MGPNQLTSSCTAKEIKKKTKRQLKKWEKIISNNATDEQLKSKKKKKNQKPNGKMRKRPE